MNWFKFGLLIFFNDSICPLLNRKCRNYAISETPEQGVQVRLVRFKIETSPPQNSHYIS